MLLIYIFVIFFFEKAFGAEHKGGCICIGIQGGNVLHRQISSNDGTLKKKMGKSATDVEIRQRFEATN